MSKLLQPFYQDDSRGKINECEICRKKFHILNRVEHKCKRCFRSVCVACAPDRAKTYKQDGTSKDHRVCKRCQAENRLILKYFQDYKLKFGQDSEFSTVWVKRINKQKKPYSVIMAEYSENLAETNQSIQKFKRESSVIFEDIYKSYNYSIRHFIELTKGNTPNKQVQQAISNVMVSVLSKVGSLSYFPEMTYLAAFFLSFASECQAYMILTGIFQKVYPQYQTIFRPKRDNLLVKQVKSIVKMVEQLIEPSEKDKMAEIKQYLDSQANKMLNTLTINFCNFEVTLHLIHETLQKASYLELYKGIASLVYLSRDIIIKRVSYDQVERYILKNITLQNVKAQMCRLQKVDVENVSNRVENQASTAINSSNPTNQKVATLQKMITLIQAELQKRTEQLNQSNTKWYQCSKEIQEEKKLTGHLKQQLCIIGCRLEQIHQYQQIKSKYQQSFKIIKQLEIKNRKMKNEINLLLAKEQQYQNQIQQFKFIYEGGQDSLVKLQTENEVLKLKLQVKDIKFQTDHFQGQILDKNRKLLDYEEKLDSANIKIKFLQKSIAEMEEQLAAKSGVKQQPRTQQSSTQNIEHIKQYKEQIQLSVITLKRQKQRLEQLTKANQQYEEKIKQLQLSKQTIEKQRNLLKQKLDEMIKLETAPKDEDEGLVQLIDKEISREDQLIRKSDFQKIKNRVKHYQHELKIKTLDLRLKSNKMQQYKNKNCQAGQILKIPVNIAEIMENETLNGNASQNKQKEDCLLF